VVEAMQRVVRFWLDRGVDGYRVDAIDRISKDAELRDDPPSSGRPFGLPLAPAEQKVELLHSRNSSGVADAIGAIREAAGDSLLIGEVYLPTARVAPYLEAFDLFFVFELLHTTAWDARTIGPIIEEAVELQRGEHPAAGWVLSNHDFGRLVSRFGRDNARLAAMLLLTLPGTAFCYYGDEIALGEGDPGELRYDRAGRDRFRHPMQWDSSPNGGFTTGEPWLPLTDPAERSVEGERGDPGSTLTLWRDLIALRRRLGPGFQLREAEPGVLAYERGDHIVGLNLSGEPAAAPADGEPMLGTHRERTLDRARLLPHAGAVWLR
jgi:alpha-glucosidase